MKRHPSGYTLIELLVVMAIILILAGVSFGVVQMVLKRMRITQAQTTATLVQGALNEFYNTYQKLPCDAKDDVTIDLNSPEGLAVLRALLNEEVGDEALNVNKRTFLDLNLAKGAKAGLLYDASGKVLKGLYDPWGGSYKIRIDGDSNGEIEVQPKAAASGRLLKRRQAAVWSDGADGADGVDGTGTVKDDVMTW